MIGCTHSEEIQKFFIINKFGVDCESLEIKEVTNCSNMLTLKQKDLQSKYLLICYHKLNLYYLINTLNFVYYFSCMKQPEQLDERNYVKRGFRLSQIQKMHSTKFTSLQSTISFLLEHNIAIDYIKQQTESG